MPEPACEWVTCEGVEAEPGSLFCKPHGRMARLEGAPWRRPGVPIAPPAPSSSTELEAAEAAAFTAPAPASPPARPLQPAMPECRRDGCTEPPLAKTIASRSNRWRNLCEAHYTEARRNALGSRRRTQLLEVAGPPAPAAPLELGPGLDGPGPSPNGPGPLALEPTSFPPLELDAERHPDETTYSDCAAELVELAAQVDDAAAALELARDAWHQCLERCRELP